MKIFVYKYICLRLYIDIYIYNYINNVYVYKYKYMYVYKIKVVCWSSFVKFKIRFSLGILFSVMFRRRNFGIV